MAAEVWDGRNRIVGMTLPLIEFISCHRKDTMTYKQLIDHLIDESRVDEIGLWYIVKLLRRDLGISSDDEIREIVAKVTRDLLNDSAISVGNYDASPSHEWVPWDLPTETVIANIVAAMKTLGRDPSLGEIVVFNRID